MNPFATHIAKQRTKACKLSREIAIGLGIDAALYSRFESGKRIPNKKQVLLIAELLDLDSKDLLVRWAGSRILYELRDEPHAMEALLLAESEIQKLQTSDAYSMPHGMKALLKKADALKKKLHHLRHLNSRKIVEALELEYTFQSNKIEGNTLTLRETDLVVNKGLTISGKSMREHLEAINHSDAIAFVLDLISKNNPLNASKLLQVHQLVLRGIDNANAGKYRNVQVNIGGSEFVPVQPFLVPKKMEEYFEWYLSNQAQLHPIILAAEMHERLVTIHPFVDGNGRTARLIMNLLLLREGYVIANIKGDSKSRLQYYDALEAAQRDGNKTKFLQFIVETEIESIQKYLSILEPR
ncbi:MAG: Fic family protein [Bacteroidetes bacterium]|nr:Fic family protein [Bacteroidota bacterium]